MFSDRATVKLPRVNRDSPDDTKGLRGARPYSTAAAECTEPRTGRWSSSSTRFRKGSAKEAKESRRTAHSSQDELAARSSQQQPGPNTPPAIEGMRPGRAKGARGSEEKEWEAREARERCEVALIDFVTHVECLVGEEEMQSDRREVRRLLRQSVRLERGLLPQLMPSSTGKVNWIGGELKEPGAQDQSSRRRSPSSVNDRGGIGGGENVRRVLVDEHRTTRVSSAVNGQQPCEEELNKLSATRPAGWKPPAGQVKQRLLRPAWSQERDQPVRGLIWCPVVAPRKTPQYLYSQAATQPAASEPGPSTPPPAKRSKRTKAESAAEPTKGKGKAQGQGCQSQASTTARQMGALPAKGKEYPGLGYKRLRDKPPKAQQQQQQPAEAQ
ncbi:hypothetical protein QJQ45_025199 [Haematococcus lacustris]|nr:hypothetical protein QJQ45_025199 [Haematococcus lacustris]